MDPQYSVPEAARSSSVGFGADADAPGSLTPESSRPIIALEQAELDRLGSARPPHFKSTWAEAGFVLSVCMAQILVEYFVSGFNVLVPPIVAALHIPPQSQTWPASAFSLVIACFLLPMGRAADMFGGKPLFLLGIGWLAVWTVVGGFAKNELMLDFSRAVAGLGPAAFLPASIELIGTVYVRPGPRKNMAFAIYGSCAPLGFFLGIFFAGLAAQLMTWRWYFFFGAIFSVVCLGLAWMTMPDIRHEGRSEVKMDWTGAVLIVGGLILVVYALTDAANAPRGWMQPYILGTVCAGVVLLAAAVYWEGWRAAQPLVPGSLFRVKGFAPVVASMCLQFGALGICLLYMTFYMDKILGGTPLQIVAWFSPMCVGGIVIFLLTGYILHLVSGTVLMAVAGISYVLAPLLFAVMPTGGNYWAFVFPAMITGTIGIDLSMNVSNIFISTALPEQQQGLAGAVINSNMHLSIAFFLALADILMHHTREQPLLQQYRYVFWFEVGVAATALAIMLFFVRIPRAKADLTADEKRVLEEGSVSCAQAAVGDV